MFRLEPVLELLEAGCTRLTDRLMDTFPCTPVLDTLRLKYGPFMFVDVDIGRGRSGLLISPCRFHGKPFASGCLPCWFGANQIIYYDLGLVEDLLDEECKLRS